MVCTYPKLMPIRTKRATLRPLLKRSGKTNPSYVKAPGPTILDTGVSGSKRYVYRSTRKEEAQGKTTNPDLNAPFYVSPKERFKGNLQAG